MIIRAILHRFGYRKVPRLSIDAVWLSMHQENFFRECLKGASGKQKEAIEGLLLNQQALTTVLRQIRLNG